VEVVVEPLPPVALLLARTRSLLRPPFEERTPMTQALTLSVE